MDDVSFLTSSGIDIQKSLELFGDMGTYHDKIGEFVTGIEQKLNKLSMYKDAGDMADYAIFAHSLKSDAKNFGFVKLADVSLVHEEKSKLGDQFYIREHFTELEQEVLNAKKIITQYLNQYNISPQKTGLRVFNKDTILVADDSNIVRNFVKRIFINRYDVGIAKDGQEAIQLIESNKNNHKIVAILLDLNMPNVDGFAVLDYMSKNDLYKEIPVSIISGDSSKETIERAFKYPIIDMLGKPFNDTDVMRVVEKTISVQDLI